MARPIRVEYEDAVYHVMARGNEQRAIYRDVTNYQSLPHTPAQAREPFGLGARSLLPNRITWRP